MVGTAFVLVVDPDPLMWELIGDRELQQAITTSIKITFGLDCPGSAFVAPSTYTPG